MQKLGPADPAGVATTTMNIGVVYFKQGKYAEALKNFDAGRALLMQYLPPDHPQLEWCFQLTSNANFLLGNEAAASATGALAKAAARRSQTQCAGPDCTSKLREDGAPLDVCVKCRRTFYCSKACQTADWKREGGHKAKCKALIAEGEGRG